MDGIQRKVNYRVRPGEVAEVLLESREAASSQLEGTEERPQILYEDGDVLAALKPAGLVTHPAGGQEPDGGRAAGTAEGDWGFSEDLSGRYGGDSEGAKGLCGKPHWSVSEEEGKDADIAPGKTGFYEI